MPADCATSSDKANPAECILAGPLGLPILLLHGRQDRTFPATLAEQTATVIP